MGINFNLVKIPPYYLRELASRDIFNSPIEIPTYVTKKRIKQMIFTDFIVKEKIDNLDYTFAISTVNTKPPVTIHTWTPLIICPPDLGCPHDKGATIVCSSTDVQYPADILGIDIIADIIPRSTNIIAKVELTSNFYFSKSVLEKILHQQYCVGVVCTLVKDPNDKTKPIGYEIIDNLTFNPDTETWENGKIYDPQSGKVYNSTAKLENDTSLEVEGYWKFKFLGKTMKFRKVNFNF